jgi:hypothetical protein
MTLLEKAERKPNRSKGIIALLVAVLGTIGIVAYTLYGSRQLNSMDLAMLFVILTVTAYGTTETIVRGLLTAVAVYLATAVASSFYTVLTPYARTFLDLLANMGMARPSAGPVDTSALAFSFAFASVIIWMVLEALFRVALPETHLSALGPVDRVGGALIYLVIGVALATLLFHTIGYGVAGRGPHNRAALRPEFRQTMNIIHQSQSYWFGGRPPVVYIYD